MLRVLLDGRLEGAYRDGEDAEGRYDADERFPLMIAPMVLRPISFKAERKD